MESVQQTIQADVFAGAKKRLNEYRDKQQAGAPVHRKKRSHSRGNSITNMDEIISSMPSPPLSRSSSHRRRSSISTRRESTEVMGLIFQDDDQKDSDKADVQLRTLFALEGKTSSPLNTAFGFTKVDLPDFGSETDKKAETGGPSKSPLFSTNNSLAGKRDSFGKLLTPTAGPGKELHTLLEEDEGEDAHGDEPSSPAIPAPAPRHRPRSLNLRPSSFRASLSLPTPSPTPPLRTPKLKSLTLASSTVVTGSPKSRRSSLLATSSNSSCSISVTESDSSTRHSSLSYLSSGSADSHSQYLGNPSQMYTPSPSPTMESHTRSMSPTELLAHSTFLSQSHASFLARIAALEEALARTTTPSPALTEPSEELLEMLSDLKSERDSLKRSLDDLRARCDDQEKQMGILSRRIDHERREGWVAKEKLNLAEAEKVSINKEKDALRDQVAALKERLDVTTAQLQVEKNSRIKAEKDLLSALEASKLPTTPYPYPTSYRSSQCSIDSQVDSPTFDSQSTSVKFTAKSNVEHDATSEPSFYSGSMSSAYSEAQVDQDRPINPLQDRQNALSSACTWSFATAHRRQKSEPKKDRFFACLEDPEDESSPSPVTKATSSSDRSIGLGFGFDLSEEDPTFNFGQPATRSPVEESSSSIVEFGSAPLMDDDESTFSFCQEIEVPKSLEAPPVLTPRPSKTPKPAVPSTFIDPSTPTPRHRARDSLEMRRRHPPGKGSIDLTGTYDSPPTSLSSHSPSFAFPSPATSDESTTLSSPNNSVTKPVPRVIAAPIMLSPPPPRKNPNRPTTSLPSKPPAVNAPSPSRKMDATLRPILKLPSVPASSLSEPELVPRTPSPMCSPAKSPLSSISFSALASFLPNPWSPKPAPPITPVSPIRRDSLERARMSRERQLSRLRSEGIARDSISSTESFRGVRRI